MRACHYSGLYRPGQLTRSSLEQALQWAHQHGETGPALIRFGWACFREALFQRGLDPWCVIGHRQWVALTEEGQPDTHWAHATEAAQYDGLLAPSARATKA